MYQIKEYSFMRAKQLGVEIKPSNKGNSKIDVYKNGKYITSIGAKGYSDFPTYIQDDGIEFARKRRELYWNRHKKDTGIRGYYALNILW